MILTFHHDDPFTIATDEKGRTYRILLASGNGKAGYFLKPYDGNKAVHYRGKYVWQGESLYALVDAAEKSRPVPATRSRQGIEVDFA